MNIDVGRDFFAVAIASGSFGISLASPILSFTFTPEPGVASGSITFNGTTQAIGAGNLSIVFPATKTWSLPSSS
jgi:hypothetical protein